MSRLRSRCSLRAPFEPDPGHAGEGTGQLGNSTFLAKLIGPLALALGLGVLLNRDAVRAVLGEFIHNRAIMFLAGMISFPAGLAVVLVHNVWVADWPVIITVMGWLTTITGAFRLVAPDATIRFGRRAYETPNGVLFGGISWVVLGVILTFFGYLKGALS